MDVTFKDNDDNVYVMRTDGHYVKNPRFYDNSWMVISDNGQLLLAMRKLGQNVNITKRIKMINKKIVFYVTGDLFEDDYLFLNGKTYTCVMIPIEIIKPVPISIRVTYYS